MACPAGQESPHNPGFIYNGTVTANGGCGGTMMWTSRAVVAAWNVNNPRIGGVPTIIVNSSKSLLGSQPYFRDPDGPTTATALPQQRSFQVYREGDALPPDPTGGTCSTCSGGGKQSAMSSILMSVVVIGGLIGIAVLAIKFLK